jgi:hypothetical protein
MNSKRASSNVDYGDVDYIEEIHALEHDEL